MDEQLEALKELTELFNLDSQQKELLEALFRQTYNIAHTQGELNGIKISRECRE